MGQEKIIKVPINGKCIIALLDDSGKEIKSYHGSGKGLFHLIDCAYNAKVEKNGEGVFCADKILKEGGSNV